MKFRHSLAELDPVTGRPGAIQINSQVFDSHGELVHNVSENFLNEADQKYLRQAW